MVAASFKSYLMSPRKDMRVRGASQSLAPGKVGKSYSAHGQPDTNPLSRSRE